MTAGAASPDTPTDPRELADTVAIDAARVYSRSIQRDLWAPMMFATSVAKQVVDALATAGLLSLLGDSAEVEYRRAGWVTATRELAEARAEIDRLTASPDPATHPSARNLVDLWDRLDDTERLNFAARVLDAQQANALCAIGRCRSGRALLDLDTQTREPSDPDDEIDTPHGPLRHVPGSPSRAHAHGEPVREWRTGEPAVWRGHHVTVVDDADPLRVELPNGDVTDVDSAELEVPGA